jgi:hypothetical protein
MLRNRARNRSHTEPGQFGGAEGGGLTQCGSIALIAMNADLIIHCNID